MLLELNAISKTYSSGGTAGRMVLNDLSLQLDQGETMAILGPSGSGKSTLLNIIGTLDLPDSGEIKYAGTALNQLNEKELASFRNMQVGFIFQFHHLLPQCTVYENVLIPTLPIKERTLKDQCKERAASLMKAVGLWDQRNQFPNTLSGGECQRTAVIRSLINSPKLILADEPTGSLDRTSAQSTLDVMLKLNREFGTALIVVTHAEGIARQMDKVFTLMDGRLHPIPADKK